MEMKMPNKVGNLKKKMRFPLEMYIWLLNKKSILN